MDKKTIAIAVLSLIIICLIVCIVWPGDSESEAILSEIRSERDTALESNRLIAIENQRIRNESTELRRDNQKSADYNTELEQQNNEYKQLIDDIGRVATDTRNIVGEYGDINNDFAEFIRQNSPEN